MSSNKRSAEDIASSDARPSPRTFSGSRRTAALLQPTTLQQQDTAERAQALERAWNSPESADGTLRRILTLRLVISRTRTAMIQVRVRVPGPRRQARGRRRASKAAPSYPQRADDGSACKDVDKGERVRPAFALSSTRPRAAPTRGRRTGRRRRSTEATVRADDDSAQSIRCTFGADESATPSYSVAASSGAGAGGASLQLSCDAHHVVFGCQSSKVGRPESAMSSGAFAVPVPRAPTAHLRRKDTTRAKIR
ncbi:hypothetical protein DFH09DRAFT_1377586 [Mycena vulgaris]|nr:hypothetical protein DFH09DRAFT_1377586 [Mycena vulgaris]